MSPSIDKMLQGRLFSYPDTHRHRLGGNYEQIPINCPYRAKIHNGHRDGVMRVDGNGGIFFIIIQDLNPTMNQTQSKEVLTLIQLIKMPDSSHTESLV